MNDKLSNKTLKLLNKFLAILIIPKLQPNAIPINH